MCCRCRAFCGGHVPDARKDCSHERVSQDVPFSPSRAAGNGQTVSRKDMSAWHASAGAVVLCLARMQGIVCRNLWRSPDSQGSTPVETCVEVMLGVRHLMPRFPALRLRLRNMAQQAQLPGRRLQPCVFAATSCSLGGARASCGGCRTAGLSVSNPLLPAHDLGKLSQSKTHTMQLASRYTAPFGLRPAAGTSYQGSASRLGGNITSK